ncbi:hypothetical protein [Nonomuraea angiospora]|uniref:hypothetical protein n=1 Tax=Nonomuraea angiospora TaxID=46172 RepID=UPI0029BAEFEF|nr:hypothetical protein [Nonomuraea angiospora]MDX3100438.1 hypothetical protein [Nonomuraea angiospora]
MEAKRYMSKDNIGAMFGVSGATVGKWLTRYADTDHPTPEPAAWIGDTPGWIDATAWKAWKLALPGRGAGGGPLPLGQAREEYREALAASQAEHPNDATAWHHEVRALKQIAAAHNVDEAALKELAGQIMEANPQMTNEEADIRAVATAIRSSRGKKLTS